MKANARNPPPQVSCKYFATLLNNKLKKMLNRQEDFKVEHGEQIARVLEDVLRISYNKLCEITGSETNFEDHEIECLFPVDFNQNCIIRQKFFLEHKNDITMLLVTDLEKISVDYPKDREELGELELEQQREEIKYTQDALNLYETIYGGD